MSDTKKYIEALFAKYNIVVDAKRNDLLEAFTKKQQNIDAVAQIQKNQKQMMDNWELENKIYKIINIQFMIPNASAGKAYNVVLDYAKLGLQDVIYLEFTDLEKYGLQFNVGAQSITGTPTQSGDCKIKMLFKVDGENEETPLHEKIINLVINADPKSLWKNIPSNLDKDAAWQEANFWKPDETTAAATLGTKNIVVASKRGRSHANVGSFRDDDFAFKYFEETDWSIVCVADGAGSASHSREGSRIACNGIIKYFSENFSTEKLLGFDALIAEHNTAPTDETNKQLNIFVYENLGKAAMEVHNNLAETASLLEINLKDFHSTLIFTLFKKYEFGYVILSFGVGDCPIGIVNLDATEVKLMNWLDVGEYGGGTRFITMPEIFTSDKFTTRFGFKVIPDFKYLMLMTDGIYDPKFVVEANLEKIEKWQEFIADLQGTNDDKTIVNLQADNKNIETELSTWMDFWSPGNHDDRTLAIIF